MQQVLRFIVFFICLNFVYSISFADPWFTGPLLAPAGHTVPRGHTNFEIYGIDVFSRGQYNQLGQIIPRPLFRSVVANPILTHGFTDWLDVQLSVPYVFNSTQGQNFNRLADVSTVLGIQLFEQKKATNRVDLRLILQEIFPTGRYDHLNPTFLGTDSTGLGSYQTLIGLNLQYLIQIYNDHYLRTRLFISRLHYSPVTVNGFNSYGGAADTRGVINTGAENDIDLAFEFTLTQHWVAVMEGYISQGKGSQFNGFLTIGRIGGPRVNIGSGDFTETALAPALEYNFNEHVGVIGGVWFPVSGKNTAHYINYLLALNAYW
jgi:hypothetical protein